MAIAPPPPIHELRKHRKSVRSIQKEVASGHASRADRIALFITGRVGTIGFFFTVFTWTACWLSWNLLAPKNLQFDPPMGFVLWLFISNLIQLMLMPLIMVGQNVQSRHADVRAESDLEINIKAEEEIELILRHLEYQNALLLAMMEKQGLKIDDLATDHPKKPA